MAEQYQILGRTAAEIVAAVEAGISADALRSGTALPSVRALAAALGVAPATVAAAYQTLRRRGIVETAGRNGTRVRRRSSLVAHQAEDRLPPGVLDLAHGGPDPALLPDLAPGLAGLGTTPGGYRQSASTQDLVAVARRRFAADGVRGSFAVTGGALDGIERVLSARLRPGDIVAVEDPCWANLRDLIAALGLEVRPMSMDADGPTGDGLAAALTAGAAAVIMTSRAHNPTGAVITAERAGRLREILAGHPEVLAIEDDHWAELSTDPLYLVADAARRWIFLRSVSKPYGPDLRVAIACGDEVTIRAVRGRMRIGSGWVSTILQRIVVGIWQDPATAATLADASEAYRDRRQSLLRRLHDRGIPAQGHTGLNVWIPVSDETHAVATLRDHGFAVSPGAHYRINAAPAIRITVSALAITDIPRLVDAVAAARQASYPLALAPNTTAT